MQDMKKQANELISLHKGDIVEHVIEQQQQYLYNTKKDMLNDLIVLIEHDIKWCERAETLDDYISDYPEELSDWVSDLIDMALNNDIYIDDILIEAIGDDEKKMFFLEERLRYILKECILRL